MSHESKPPAARSELFARAEEFLQIFKKGAEFTQELLKENERLRYKVAELEARLPAAAERGGTSAIIAALERRIAQLEQEKADLLARFSQVEAENKEFADRYLEIEEENNNLANLYIASYQLHSTLDFKEVIHIIQEIIINLIGAEEFAIMLLDEKTNLLAPVATEGMEDGALPAIQLGTGTIGQVAKIGEPYFYQGDITDRSAITPLNPLVCIPLKIKEHVIGVIVIYKLLQQKQKFANVDYELFTLLAGHAATAIFSSKLYSESERKLSTIQGFIDLLTK
ncbi:MAG TPA: GAF domain-containing protein [Thermodesulfobacteriota bacterium]|nr:GAF domain-containing protein [Thermodesulfobacteriota bacterium]